jgi:uncharacterized protein with von Willebrand factor type A (vWA) domain
MSDHPGTLPRAAQPFVTFATLLRQYSFLVAPEQIAAFLAAIDLLGPCGIIDIRRAAHATLGPQPERRAEFDALFDAHFLGKTTTVEVAAQTEDDEELRAREGERGSFDPAVSDEPRESGQAAASAEMLAARRFGAESETEILRRFQRAVPERLPRRRGYRKRVDRRGRVPDLRRSLREAIRNDGEVMRLPRLRRRTRQRRVLLLVDVSGSMKERTEAHLRFAHALAQAVERIEIFTIGTRLTRVSKALALKRREQALAAASTIVADWDGGTRIGDALRAFLAVPRFASYARGALVLIISDGFERGDHRAMTDAVARLKSLAWRVSWLTPLLADPRYRPETGALKSILPLIDDLADGSSTERLCEHVLRLSIPTARGRNGHAA